ncbi:MAG TPA: SufS family cysteine desulfurase [Candidatus Onthovivens sp.]|nr:SufS family cysteine desulfurase [Candidatus Onthovivens sp.]
MIDVKKIRNDFPIIRNYKGEKPFIYFDNAATTLKPDLVIDACHKYYAEESANAHRGDYDLAFKVDKKVDEVRSKIANFINAPKGSIIFTSGASMSMNLVAYGMGMKYLTADDEIILTEAEHASNVLPWFKVAEMTGAKIKYIELDEEGRCKPEALKKVISNKTKIVSIAQVTNVLGYEIDIKEMSKIAHQHGAILVCDAAQSAPHLKIDVVDLDCDFLLFSAHKMCGPTGIGVLYGKYNLLSTMDPFLTGGGDNARFDMCGNVAYLQPPAKFEAGTMNLDGIYGFGAAVDYLESLGMDNINKYEKELRKYAISKLEKLDNVIIYNKNADAGIITLNVKGVFPQDEASYLNSKGICVRSGEHCAKLLKDLLKTVGTVRASFYFYNTYEEIDLLVEALKKGEDFLDAYFN